MLRAITLTRAELCGLAPKACYNRSVMNLFPVKTIPLATDLSPAALAGLLRETIRDDPAAPFSGSVAAGGFVISRLNEFRSSFMPLLRGSFSPAPGGGTGVRLRLSPPGTVLVFMTIWLGFLAVVAAVIVGAHAQDANRSLLPLLLPAGLAAISWLVMVSVFRADARWAVAHLLERMPALRPPSPGQSTGPRSRRQTPLGPGDATLPTKAPAAGNQFPTARI